MEVTVQALDLAAWVQRVVLSRKVPPPPAAITRGLGGEASLVQANGLGEGLSARGSVVMKMDIEGVAYEASGAQTRGPTTRSVRSPLRSVLSLLLACRARLVRLEVAALTSTALVPRS